MEDNKKSNHLNGNAIIDTSGHVTNDNDIDKNILDENTYFGGSNKRRDKNKETNMLDNQSVVISVDCGNYIDIASSIDQSVEIPLPPTNNYKPMNDKQIKTTDENAYFGAARGGEADFVGVNQREYKNKGGHLLDNDCGDYGNNITSSIDESINIPLPPINNLVRDRNKTDGIYDGLINIEDTANEYLPSQSPIYQENKHLNYKQMNKMDATNTLDEDTYFGASTGNGIAGILSNKNKKTQLLEDEYVDSNSKTYKNRTRSGYQAKQN